MRSMVHRECRSIASHFLAKLSTFCGLMSGPGFTKARPMFAMFLSLPFAVRTRSFQNRPAICLFSSCHGCDIRTTKGGQRNGGFHVQAQDAGNYRREKSYPASENRTY